MAVCLADIQRLRLLIERLTDAELLPDAAGAVLLTEADAARHALEAGAAQTALRHVERIARLAETHRGAGALAPAVLDAAANILDSGKNSSLCRS